MIKLMSLYSDTSPETSSPFVTLLCNRRHSPRMETTSPGSWPSKETSVCYAYDSPSDSHDVANQQLVNVIMFSDLKFRD